MILFLLVFFYFPVKNIYAITCQDPLTPAAVPGSRCVSCDLCGYCWKPEPGGTVRIPGNWQQCKNCLYGPTVSDVATDNETVVMNDVGGSFVTRQPISGAWYTALGCIQTTGSFSTEGAAGEVIQLVLGRLVFSIVGGVALLYLIYGAFLIMTSRDDPEKLNQGKRVVYGALIGVIFSLTAVLIIGLISSGILKIPSFGQQ